ncbi:unnamed protein product, partial [marine sediment metagenome]
MLDEIRRQMFDDLSLDAQATDRASVGDVDLYFRVGNAWDYTLKFKRVDAGLRVGVLLPAATRRNLNSPASVPFGGKSHYGVYVAGDVELELKDDIKVGLFFDVI